MAPQGPGEVVIDAGTADEAALRGRRPDRRRDRSARSTATAITGTVSLRQRRLARRREHRRLGRHDRADAAGQRGPLRHDLDRRQARAPRRPQLVRAVKPLVPASLEVKDAAAAGRRPTRRTLNDGMKIDPATFLLGFGGIALLVGAFVIFNTLSITVAQRTREFATLRTLGASRKQVMRSVVLEGLVIGLVASVIGLVARARARQGPDRAVQRARRRPARRPATVIAPRTIIVSLLARHRRHAAREHPARAARDPRPADRGGPRGRDAAAVALRRALGQDRRRRDRGVAGRDLASACSPAASAARRVALLLGVGVLGLFAGHRAAGAAPRQAAGPRRGLAGAPRRRRRRRAGRRQRRPQPGPHRLDRRRADDRAHARDGRGGARRRHQRRTSSRP